MTDEATTVPTWIYSASGESRLIEHPRGAKAPEGWAFSPPASGNVEELAATPAPSAVPATSPPAPLDDTRLADLTARVEALEEKLEGVLAILDDMTAPAESKEEAKATTDKKALVAEAQALGHDVDGRTAEAKLRELIASGPAKPPEV